MIAQTILLYSIGALIGWVIFYYVVKAAVKNAIKEAKAEKHVTSQFKTTHEKSATPAQIELQQKYEKGEISFEHYQKEWNKAMDK